MTQLDVLRRVRMLLRDEALNDVGLYLLARCRLSLERDVKEEVAR